MRAKFFLLLFPFILGACGDVGGINLANYPAYKPEKEDFILCHGYQCSYKSYAWLTPGQWKSIEKTFKPAPTSAEEERLYIGRAVAKMENYVGDLVGTDIDGPKAPGMRSSDYELDCIDETVNTSRYLHFLEEAGLLRYHFAGTPAFRGVTHGKYPHNSATIVENGNGDVYVVDAYQFANGVFPDIRPLHHWLKYRLEDLD
jgi:hypothetical protein